MSKVQLYVYDLSRGLAKQMSLMLTGKQIDGIWHTSVVAWNREIFYGQGILTSHPGSTHHGPPLHIIDVGETHIDEDTFNEYIQSLGEMYTPSKYHLIEFNCNHFTADVVGFLTGQEIPKWISGLPAEFLSTPFGQAMRPQIDAMFRQTAPSERPIPGPSPSQPGVTPQNQPQSTPSASGTSTPALASALLQSVAARASQQTANGSSSTPPNPETSPLTLVSSVTHFHSILKQHPAVIVNFTNTPTCPPCRAIKPIYETISSVHSSTYGVKGARFVEVELSIGEGRSLAQEYGVHATPTFMFFRNGKKKEEMKGASKRELEGRVEGFLEECFPSHVHRKMFLPSIEGLPSNPIIASNTPNYPALLGKLEGFLGGKGREDDLYFLREKVIPLLEGASVDGRDLQELVEGWIKSTEGILGTLKAEETFPVIDLWRVGLLKPKISSLLAMKLRPSSSTASSTSDPISSILELTVQTLASLGPKDTPKPFLLTVLRLITNLLASNELDNLILSPQGHTEIQEKVVSILVESLLHPDQSVRSSAAGIAVNAGAWRQRNKGDELLDVDWEVEVVSALVEAVGREGDEDVSHRLLAALAMIIYLSPRYESDTKDLLEVLGAKDMIYSKSRGWKKKEVKKLGEEIAGKLC
ncbi:hypothetical protein I302_103978 [Kwoniella bestiolae CBS 10118]|uniref:Thioredoxin n=1 Tax=Kwoniella bestiolae CBS 10118 TaxID=1296100 RepID=A0A1B9G9X3_9TREE|nr:hypothetical protein I302_02684 [Kwoniella bestiolae CBS 10118]OCF27835.1 hypothetical protein I302_02684 [Kwoniella bestiolae CBS 10118]